MAYRAGFRQAFDYVKLYIPDEDASSKNNLGQTVIFRYSNLELGLSQSSCEI